MATLLATPEPTRKPLEQTFDEEDLGVLPEGRLVPIESATLEPLDSMILTVTFVGSVGYLPGDPCSRDYVVWMSMLTPTEVSTRNVAVVELPVPGPTAQPGPTGPPGACEAVGFRYAFHVRSAEYPFGQLNDRSGQVFYLSSGAGVVEDLPEGWSHQVSFDAASGPPPVTQGQVYAPDEVSGPPYEGPGRLVLYEGFPASPGYGDDRIAEAQKAGSQPVEVVVDGQPEQVWVDPSTGQLLLVWVNAGKSSVLVGYKADFTVAELVRAAESITPCCG